MLANCFLLMGRSPTTTASVMWLCFRLQSTAVTTGPEGEDEDQNWLSFRKSEILMERLPQSLPQELSGTSQMTHRSKGSLLTYFNKV